MHVHSSAKSIQVQSFDLHFLTKVSRIIIPAMSADSKHLEGSRFSISQNVRFI